MGCQLLTDPVGVSQSATCRASGEGGQLAGPTACCQFDWVTVVCWRHKPIVIKDIRLTNVWLSVPRGRMPTVKGNLESERLRANLHKIVRILNRGIRQRATAERVNVHPPNYLSEHDH